MVWIDISTQRLPGDLVNRRARKVAVDPPKFLFHVNDVELAHFSYQRYLENQIRASYPFTGTPIQLEFRESEDRHRE